MDRLRNGRRQTALQARELTVKPGHSITIKDPGPYGMIVVQGSGSIGKLDVDSPNFIRFGEMTKDEVFVTARGPARGFSSGTRAVSRSSACATLAPTPTPSFPPWEITRRRSDRPHDHPFLMSRTTTREDARLMDDPSWDEFDLVDRMGEDLFGRFKAMLEPTEYLIWADRPLLPRPVCIPFVPALFVSMVAGLSGFSLAAMFGLISQDWMDHSRMILAWPCTCGSGRHDRRAPD